MGLTLFRESGISVEQEVPMKSLFSALFILAASPAFAAEFTRTTCYKASNNDFELILFISDSQLTKVTFQNSAWSNSEPEYVVTGELHSHLFTEYFIAGHDGFLNVENKILEGQGGTVHYGIDQYDCRP